MRVAGRDLAVAGVLVGMVAMGAGCAPPPALSEDGGDLEPLDPARLDRSAEGGPCGYPGEGAAGYGTDVGQRLANSDGFTLIDCDGTERTLGDFLCERTEGAGDFNRGVLVNIGAGWCGPCQEETLEFPELYEEFHGEGIEIVQIMFQDWDAQSPTRGFCSDWTTGQWGEAGLQPEGLSLAFPVLIDQIFDWTSIYLQDPQSATPVNLLIDANANIRWKSEGQKVGLPTLRAQLRLVLDDPYGEG